MRHRSTSTTAPLILAALCVACGSGNTPAGGGADAAAPAAVTDTADAAPVDACALIPAEDITALLGVAVEGRGTGGQGQAACLWENPDTYESVSLEIGEPRTAVNGTLPPPEPGMPEVGTLRPDGMRLLGRGQMEFAASGRVNSVQVAVLRMSGPEADDAAAALARQVGPQVPE
ncbi:DUF3558 domain-containing protein [Mycobacterium sp. PS03-16]|uniref:DUF3558 domain-containing protein n=1 Tax=Mycobacterium sp. PS03-16 TaxID=2559611 RepID=UPI001073AAE8|nr:DUF3558 domain-containing protein [Mycobacterium sp. PS03-16]TFV61460.1 DUF3558 domain-containing protein [Mycobacterium sp. PS03-16]